MKPHRRMSREEAIPLVQRLLDADVANEAEADDILAELTHGLAFPHISEYIFWDFDPEISAEKIVDRALAYKPFAL